MEVTTESNTDDSFPSVWESNFNYDFELNSTGLTCHQHKLSITDLSLIILYGLICLVGLIGNAVIITVVSRLPKMQMVTNSYLYIMHVAITDGLFLLGIPVLILTMVQGSWPFEMIMCKVYFMSSTLSQFSKPIFFLMMIVDCYIEICRPISSAKYCTPSMAKVVCVVVWMGAAVLMMPITMYSNIISTKCGVSCGVIWAESETQKGIITFTLFSVFFTFIIPLSSIVVFGVLGVQKLRYLCCHNEEYLYRMIKLVLTLSFAHLILWLPYWILQVVLIYLINSYLPEHIVIISLIIYLLGYCSSAINPVLFILRSEKIKKSLQKFHVLK